jgi:hypothetical protein
VLLSIKAVICCLGEEARFLRACVLLAETILGGPGKGQGWVGVSGLL